MSLKFDYIFARKRVRCREKKGNTGIQHCAACCIEWSEVSVSCQGFESANHFPYCAGFGAGEGNGVDNQQLIAINDEIRYHPVEIIGAELRDSMTDMIKIV